VSNGFSINDHEQISAFNARYVIGGDLGSFSGRSGYNPEQDGRDGENDRKKRGDARVSFDYVHPKTAAIDPKLADENGDFILRGLLACGIFALAYARMKKL
jgi:hypothetical protein